MTANVDLQALLQSALERELFLGAAYRVLQLPGGTVAEGCVGRAQEAPDVPVTPDTVWDLASLTKPLATATSVLILAQEGALHLDEELARFLEGPSPSLEGISIRQFMSHVSGLKPWEKFHSQDLEPAEIIRRVRASERSRPAGTGYAYSDLGYILLGELVRAVSGEPVSEFARKRIFEPLGMSSTRYLPPAEWDGRIAATRCPDRDRALVGEVHDGNCHSLGGVAGHAGLFGSLNDLERYARMLLNGGELEGARILAPLTVRAMGRNQNTPGINGHTLGWFTRPGGFLPAGDFLPDDTFGHTGFTGTSILFTPSLGAAVILLTNRVYVPKDGGEYIRFRRRFHNAASALLQLA